MASKVQCDNCDKSATYTCADPGVNAVNYCTDCLPSWLVERAEAGHFPLVEQIPGTEKPRKKAEVKEEATSADEGNQKTSCTGSPRPRQDNGTTRPFS